MIDSDKRGKKYDYEYRLFQLKTRDNIFCCNLGLGETIPFQTKQSNKKKMALEGGFENNGYSQDNGPSKEVAGGPNYDVIPVQERRADETSSESKMVANVKSDLDDDDNPDCGWFNFRPRIIQVSFSGFLKIH